MRPPKMGDGKIVNEAIRESFDELTVWMPWAQRMPTIADSETYVREAYGRYKAREELAFLWFDKRDGSLVGSGGLHHIDWSVPKFEIGYWVRTSRQGYGYVTEAVKRLTTWCFDDADAERVEIRCDTRNTRSAAVAIRAGYTLEATLRRDGRDNAGGLRDTLIFCKLRG
jgi:RimJ/RimL family protein N-acetyltransferase